MGKVHVLINGSLRTLKDGLDPTQAIEGLRAKGYTVQRCKAPPSMKTLERYACDSVCKATDGCTVEPDGFCVHGHKSWLLVMGLI